MATYSLTSPPTVQAVQWDGTQATAAAFLGGHSWMINGSGQLVVETLRGRQACNTNDWMVRSPLTLSDVSDRDQDFILSLVSAATFTSTYTFVSNP